MSDARSLLRQQRAARRIDHPHASYSEAGKLTCIVCREPLRSDALWDGHTRTVSHRQRLLAQQKPRQRRPQQVSLPANPSTANGSGPGKPKSGSTDTPSDEALLAQIIGGGGAGYARGGQKRKHEDPDSDPDGVDADEEAILKKRSRQDMASPTSYSSAAPAAPEAMPNTVVANSSMKTDMAADADADAGKKTPTASPPGLSRRASGTPSHGVELQIPSRPATPNTNGTSGGSTPRVAPVGRSPLIAHETPALGSVVTSAPWAAFVTTAETKKLTAITTIAADNEDEDEDWAAFEAQVVNAPPPAPASIDGAVLPTESGPEYPSDAVIAAAPLTAEQIAAQARQEERSGRLALAAAQLEDEKEEAARALETEFEEMEELEARVRKLKEKREAIRRGSMPFAPVTAVENEVARPEVNVGGEAGARVEGKAHDDHHHDDEDEDEEQEEEEEEEDDWAGFRFKA